MRGRTSVFVVLLCLLSAGCATRRATVVTEGGPVFSFVTIGDSRSGQPIVQPQAFFDNIKQINRLRPAPAFVIDVGDLILGYTNDKELILKEWKAFDKAIKKIRPRSYLVAGNHDIWDEQSYAIYKERYGDTYYSFDHENSHFTVLCSEEMGEISQITGRQLEWLAKDLEEHKDATHKFVFLHRPLWGSHRGMSTSGWDKNVHPLLAEHGVAIVFAGHDHHYVNYGIRDGVQYYVTGGGGAGLGGTRELGGFHHFMVTTVAGDTVSSVVVGSDGRLQGHMVVTYEKIEAYRKMASLVALPGFDLPEKGNRIQLKATWKNPADKPVEIRYEWLTKDTTWRLMPASRAIEISGNEETVVSISGSYDKTRVMPLPSMKAEIWYEGKKVAAVEKKLQPFIRRHARVARARAPEVDGVISKDEYGSAKMNGGFVDYRGRGYPKRNSAFVVSYDDAALYVAVIADEDDPNTITAKKRERDGDIWRDDDIEIFVDATADQKTYHHFAVSLKNIQYDAIGGPEHGQFGDVKWNAKWQSAVKIGGVNYVVEIRVPFAEMDVPPPRPGDKWGLNICRQRQATGPDQPYPEMTAWSIPYANFHVPTHFGIVTFE